MSLDELLWRLNGLKQSTAEHIRVSFGRVPDANYRSEFTEFVPPFKIVECPDKCFNSDSTQAQEWHERLKKTADAAVNHKLTFFDLDNQDLGDPINWNYDHASQIDCELKPIMRVNYRDHANFGDCKLVWEPNRMHHLVILGRAYRASGDIKYAEAILDQITSWMDANPYGYGMNWRSPLELGVRLINWVWAIDLIQDSGLFRGTFKERLLHSVYLHCRDIAGKFSQGTSANNHLIGEAAGVFVAANYFNVFEECEEWSKNSSQILATEIERQSYADGCTREQALGYQFFVIQFYLVSGIVARKSGRDFDAAYWQRLQTLMLFIADLAEGGEELPMFGDRDDGYVLDLGDAAADVNALMVWGSHLFDHLQFSQLISRNSESAYWLFGLGPSEQTTMQKGSLARNITSKQFSESGYSLLQYGNRESNDQVSVFIDAAELGYTSIAAHGHADALSFAMRLNGQDFLVDPGTYDYFTFPEWRTYFRTTRAHNTVEIDGLDQSAMQGPFLWGQHAIATCTKWAPDGGGGLFEGKHTGYQRLEDPVEHQRTLHLDGRLRQLTITDHIEAKASHSARIFFHLSEHCEVLSVKGNKIQLSLGSLSVNMEFDEKLDIEILNGSLAPIGGWISRGYHLKTPINTIIATALITGSTKFDCKISW